jgi:hypothetical protein
LASVSACTVSEFVDQYQTGTHAMLYHFIPFYIESKYQSELSAASYDVTDLLLLHFYSHVHIGGALFIRNFSVATLIGCTILRICSWWCVRYIKDFVSKVIDSYLINPFYGHTAFTA